MGSRVSVKIELEKYVSTKNVLIALLSGLLIFLSLKINRSLDAVFLLAPGISWLFFPAGVKLLLVLLGRFPAVVGMFFSSLMVGLSNWASQSIWTIVYISFVSVACYPGATTICQKLFGILNDFTQVRYWHIAVLSLVATLMDVLIHQLIYFSHGWTNWIDYLNQSVAVAGGDFLGCFVVISAFNAVLGQLRLHAKTTAAS